MKSNSRFLKGFVIFSSLCLLLVCLWGLPEIGHSFVDMSPDLSYYYWPWLIFLWVTAAPWFIELILAWQIFDSIGRDEAFTLDNGTRFKKMSHIALADVIGFMAVNVVYMLIGMHHPGIMLLSIFVSLAGVAFVICTASLSDLVNRAAELQDQYDLTI